MHTFPELRAGWTDPSEMLRSDESEEQTVLKVRCGMLSQVGNPMYIKETSRETAVVIEMPTYEGMSSRELLASVIRPLEMEEFSTWNVNMADPVALHRLNHGSSQD